MPVVLVYAGLLVMLTGGLSVIRPLAIVGIRKRRMGLAVLLLGLALGLSGAMWPASLHQVTGPRLRIDEFIPAYQFNEVHSTRVRAPRDRVFRAIRAVTPGEIRFFQTLMGMRELPARLLGGGRTPAPIPGYRVESSEKKDLDAHAFAIGAAETKRLEGRLSAIEYRLESGRKPTPASEILRIHEDAIGRMGGSAVSRAGCCRSTSRLGGEGATVWVEIAARPNGERYRLTIVEEGDSRAVVRQPILDLFIRSGFLVLADDPDREIVLGTIMPFSKSSGGAPPRTINPRSFRAFECVGFAKVAATFVVEDEGGGWSRVTTETRILATDPSARRAFGIYWRVIYPGSATIRSMWLRAIKRRAEA